MMISLIIATLGRTEELATLLRSLVAQCWPDLEVIIVDQNGDDRLTPIVAEFAPRLDIRHMRSTVRRNSHARNLGIGQCRGDIVGFPDDDCIYPSGLLAHVAARFAAEPDLAMLSGPAATPSGGLGSGRWEPCSGPIALKTIWTSIICFNLFLRRQTLRVCGGFDEDLGLGARFGSSEENDLAIRVLQSGARGYYDFDLRVVHPDKRLTPTAIARAFRYGTGTGRVMRKHRIPHRIVLTFMLRSLGGVLVSLACRRWPHAQYYWHTLCGRATGYLARSVRPSQAPAPLQEALR